MPRARELHALGPLHHRCLGCGASCHGVRVRLMPGESTRIRRIGREIGVDRPVVDGALRQHHGQCVFQAADRLCRIHREVGMEAKPILCRQYPQLVVDTGSELRIGVDPGCYMAWSTWRSGPALDPEVTAVAEVVLPPDQVEHERAFLAVSAGSSLTGTLEAMCPGPTEASGLPTGLAARWVSCLGVVAWERYLDESTTGAALGAAFGQVVQALRGWEQAGAPDGLGLDEDGQAWVLEAARRMVYLRLAPGLGSPFATGMLVLLGGLAAGWVDPRPEVSGPAVAAWARILRMPAVMHELLPDLDRMRWLASGVEPGAP